MKKVKLQGQRTMTREQFEDIARTEGYDEPKEVAFEPFSRSLPPDHVKTSFVYVLEGIFILNTAEDVPSYPTGQTCSHSAGVEHAEEAGPQGARILVARKRSDQILRHITRMVLAP